MKTRIRIDGKDIEGYLQENHVLLKKDQTAWPFRDCPGDAMLALHDSDGRNEKEVRRLLRSSPVTIHVFRLVVKDGTWVFAWWERGKKKESIDLPDCFVKAPEVEECFGTFYDSNAERIVDANYAKREHTIKENALWQKKQRSAVPVSAGMIRRELAPVKEAVKGIAESVRAEKEEKAELKKDNAALREANQATSAEFQERIGQFVKALPHPQGLIYDLRWNQYLSQEKIVAKCSRLKITGCRTKKRVGELLKKIKAMARAKGYRLSDRVTGPNAPPDLPTGYVDGIDGKTPIQPKTPAAITDKAEMDSIIEAYRKASPAGQATMRDHYKEELVKELKRRALMPEKNHE